MGMRMNDQEVDEKDRPIETPLIKSVEVQYNPFDSINIRTNRNEQEREWNKIVSSPLKFEISKINNCLLSFGDIKDYQNWESSSTSCTNKLEENSMTDKREQIYESSIQNCDDNKSSSLNIWIKRFKKTIRTLDKLHLKHSKFERHLKKDLVEINFQFKGTGLEEKETQSKSNKINECLCSLLKNFKHKMLVLKIFKTYNNSEYSYI